MLMVFMNLLILLLRSEKSQNWNLRLWGVKDLQHVESSIWERILFVLNIEECIVLLCILVTKNM